MWCCPPLCRTISTLAAITDLRKQGVRSSLCSESRQQSAVLLKFGTHGRRLRNQSPFSRKGHHAALKNQNQWPSYDVTCRNRVLFTKVLKCDWVLVQYELPVWSSITMDSALSVPIATHSILFKFRFRKLYYEADEKPFWICNSFRISVAWRLNEPGFGLARAHQNCLLV